jgi:hypothetical protein
MTDDERVEAKAVLFGALVRGEILSTAPASVKVDNS